MSSEPRASEVPAVSVRALLDAGRYGDAESAARLLLSQQEATTGHDSVQTAEASYLLADSLWRRGKYAQPETKTLATQALTLREQLLGPEHPDVADSANLLALVLSDLGDNKAARPLCERALAIREKALGPDHPDVAKSLHSLAGIMRDVGDYAASRKYYERALAIREKALGPDHPDFAKSLHGLAVTLRYAGDYANARTCYERALAIREKALGPDHPEVAKSLNGLGELLMEAGDFAASRSYHERALAVREKALGPDHPDVAKSLENLGAVAQLAADYPAAREFHERALAILEKGLGRDHPDLSTTLNNLAGVFWDTGDYAAARRMMERCVAIDEKSLGSEHPRTAGALANLGVALQALGDDQAARLVLERALAIQEKALGPDHPDVAGTLSNLGELLLKDDTDVTTARGLLERGLAIREKAFGPNHADVARSLSSLAGLAARTSPRAAEQLYQRALAILESTLGDSHPVVAEVLVALARLAEVPGSTLDARALIGRALSIRERVFDPASPEIAQTHAVLAAHFTGTGEYAAAVGEALKAETSGRTHVRATVRTLGERQALLYSAVRASGLDLAIALLVDHPSETASQRRDVLDALVRSRGVVLDEMAARQRVAATARDPETERLARDLVRARDRLAYVVVRGPEGSPAGRYRKTLDQARLEKERTEEALAARSLSFRAEQDLSATGLHEVQAALPPGTALLSFVRYTRPPKVGSAADGAQTQAAAYAAFLCRAGQDPEIVPLGTAETVESAVARWRNQLDWEAKAPGLAPRLSLRRYVATATDLRRRVWDPLAPLLKGSERVFIVPDGALHLVSFAALPLDKGRFLVEAGPLLHTLSTERDVVTVSRGSTGQGLLLMGAPEFASGRRRASARSFRGATAACESFRHLRFAPLPAALQELQSIGALWKKGAGVHTPPSSLLLISGASADEAAFKDKAPGRRIVHLATHGFVLGDKCAETRGNPLLGAGLAFAGADRRLAAGANVEDGILTAEEIAAIDLSGVEWAVLSACETGLGQLTAGEGVFGLRRAFQLAGARSVIVSLWPVDDVSTRDWMESLYRRRLQDGLATAEAVRQASLDALHRRREHGQSVHPLYWAGFLAAGDWR